MKKLKRMLCIAIAGLSLFATAAVTASAAQKQTIYNSPYVTFAPDGRAWTTNAGDTNIRWYDEGTTVSTGISSVLRALQTGEHYYQYDRTGEIPIGKWKVELKAVDCCHNGYPSIDDYHGIDYNRNLCLRDHYSGWFSYCADCGQEVYPAYFYMSRETAESIDYIEVGEGEKEYYYLCPFCDNLEQGTGLKSHKCLAISANQYKVVYDVNTTETVGGYMADSIHMYNNATTYNGEPVTPITHLTPNAYTRIGYEFVGWNTEPDGSGTSYQDGQVILNLTDKDVNIDGDRGVVILYAQWRNSASILQINPNGGSYNGRTAVTTVTGSYGNRYTLMNNTIVPPRGYRVSFHTNGGNAVAPITSTRYFTDWTMVNPFHGRIRNDTYYFIAPDGNVDTIVANYGLNAITLPSATKSGSSFGGWFYDSALTRPAGGPGDKITPTQDMTLYAAWVDLRLYAVDNYTANGGKGAVDLSWTQSDSNNKVYKIYQSRDNATWKLVTSANDIATPTAISQSLAYSGSTKSYTVPYAGIYTLSAWGAQGGSYGTYTGGKGGCVTARVWLNKGEIITYTIGGQNGYNGGGTGSSYGNGGGSTTVVSNRQGVLLVAGGGGGASENGNGGAGGSSASLRADNNSAGASGQTGGGAGYVGGNAGEYIVHHCNDDCYRQETITVSPAAAFYTGATAEKTASSLSDFTAHNTNTYARAYGTMFHTEGYYTSKGTLTVGSPTNYVATPEAGTLKFTFNNAGNQAFRGVFNTPSYIIYVYDKDTNAIIHTINLDTAAHTSNEVKNKMCSGGTCYYGDSHKQTIDTWTYTDARISGSRYREYGLRFQNHDGSELGWQDLEDINVTCTLPIPASTNGVYIKVVESVNIDSSIHIAATISGVSYTYEDESKICGYTDGQIISSKPAYGGSNYINTTAAYEYTQQAGVRSGNGAFGLKSEAIGFLEVLTLKDVIATDYAAPDSISAQTVVKESMTGNQVKVNWQEPADNGTDYYHVAESYLTGSASVLCKSNVTRNTLVSGIKGYYVLTNTSPSTVVNAVNGSFVSGRSQTVALGTQVKYLHVAAVDKAGNVGGTVHIRIDAKDIEWKLYTEQL
uniref:InlB B-repeat-containing protein n=1 Tax=Acetatifactor sp. TaxID=1872090 RepID=UPI004055ACEB